MDHKYNIIHYKSVCYYVELINMTFYFTYFLVVFFFFFFVGVLVFFALELLL